MDIACPTFSDLERQGRNFQDASITKQCLNHYHLLLSAWQFVQMKGKWNTLMVTVELK